MHRDEDRRQSRVRAASPLAPTVQLWAEDMGDDQWEWRYPSPANCAGQCAGYRSWSVASERPRRETSEGRRTWAPFHRYQQRRWAMAIAILAEIPGLTQDQYETVVRKVNETG